MWSVIQTDMELLHWMCDLWYVIYVIAPLKVTVWHCDTDQCVICDRWVDKRGSSILCSPMCDASQLVVRTNRPNIDPPFVRCAQYRKYRPAISPRFDGKEYFCPQKSANLCQSITVRHMISHLYQLIFSQIYLKSSTEKIYFGNESTFGYI